MASCSHPSAAQLRGLYVILDPAALRVGATLGEVTGGRGEARPPGGGDLAQRLLHIAREAIGGGARLIQYRDKTRNTGELYALAHTLQALCRERAALFVMNDHVDIALAVEADGVHVGQRDLPVVVVRKIVPEKMLVGASTNNLKEARLAEADGADYVSVGRLFPTGSKADTRPATLESLRAVKAAVSVPVCAIGGINETNIDDVIAAGADMAAVISAVVAAEDVREAARGLVGRFAQRSVGREHSAAPER